MDSLRQVFITSGYWVTVSGDFLLYNLRSDTLDHPTISKLIRFVDFTDRHNEDLELDLEYCVLNAWSHKPNGFQTLDVPMDDNYHIVIKII